MDQTYFYQYPWPIDYVYNSRGFRDQEWPESQEELREAIWCIGDSYTVGIGQPFKHIWPQVLADRTDRRTINISMDGASNDWILRRALDIIHSVEPDHLVVMWSYSHRREDQRSHLSDENRRVYSSTSSHEQDYRHWLELLDQMREKSRSAIHCTIPDFDHLMMAESQLERVWTNVKDANWPACPKHLKDLFVLDPHITEELKSLHHCYDTLRDLLTRHEQSLLMPPLPQDVVYLHRQLDWARDRHHFDILTSQWLVQQIMPGLS